MKIKERLGRILVFGILLVLAVYSVEASGALTAVINCEGCNSIELVSSTGYAAVVEPGKVIKLKGDPGYATYTWAKNGAVIAYGPELSVTVTENVQYSLTVMAKDQAISDTRTVQINLAAGAPKNICVPSLAKIEIGSNKVALGERVPVKTDYDKNECPGAVFHWEADEGIFIENPSAKETWITVKARPPSGRNPVIKAIVTNGASQDEQEVTIVVTSNAPPTVKGLYNYYPNPPLSHKMFTVSCDKCQTGSGFNEAGDNITEFTAELLDANWKVVSSGTTTADQSKALSGVTLTAGDEGKYFLRVRAKDSHGLSSNDTEEIFVIFGNTEEDSPYIAISDIVYCDPGKPCPFDTSKTETHGLGISIHFENILDIKNPTRSKTEPLFNVNGNPCRSLNCTTVFPNAGDRKIKITMQYMRDGKPSGKVSEKIVTVIFGSPGNSVKIPVQTAKSVSPSVPQPASTAQAVKSPVETPPDIPTKPAPGLSLLGSLAVVTAAGFIRRRKNKH